MSHSEFIAAYAAGLIRVQVDAKRAADFMSSRLLLPFVLLPVFGLAVATALLGYFLAGAALLATAFAFRYLVRASGKGYVLARALERPEFYEQVVNANVLRIETLPEAPPA